MRNIAAAIVWTLALAAPARSAPGSQKTACDISAYVIDRDPNGLNVRSAPSSGARVIRTVSNAGSGVARITGQSGAWFRIARITDAETDAVLFRGDGWVHGSLLGLDVANGDPRLYEAAVARSRMVAKLVADQSGVTLIGCEGGWAKVRAAGRTGWLSPAGQCSNPLTTCS